VRLALWVFLSSGLVVSLTVAAAVVYTSAVASRAAERARERNRQAAVRDLADSASVQLAFQRLRYQQLELITGLFVTDPYLTAYLAQAATSDDRRSILDLLAERQADLGFDFAIVLDPEGRLVARTDRPGAAGDDLSGRPLVAEALERYQASGVWLEGRDLYDAVAVPLTDGFELVGFLITGSAVNDEAAQEAMRFAGAEVAVVAAADGAPAVVASSLDGERAARLESALAVADGPLARVLATGERMDAVDVELGGERWTATLLPLLDAAGAPVGATVCAVEAPSLERELAPFREIRRALVAVGLVSVVIALALAFALAFALARRTLRPVRELAAAATAARAGDYDRFIPADRDDEVGELARAFDGLLSELREKRDMETYLGELARSVPAAAGDEAPSTAPATSGEAVVLCAEYRDLAAAGASTDGLDTLSRRLRRLAHAVGRRRGRMVTAAGHRAWARFDGDGAALRALAAAAEVLAAADGPARSPALALAGGPLAEGPVDWGSERRRALVGRPVAQLEGLVREAAPGEVAFTADLYAELAEHFERAGYELAERRGVVTPRPLYLLPAALASRLTGAAAPPVEPPAAEGVTAGLSQVPGAERPTLADLAPGAVVGDRFEILSVLGAGGMGVVYKARDRELDEVVALKMLRPDQWGEEQVARLKDEVKLARKITHPNVLRTYDLGEVGGLPFVSMEYVRGVTLRTLLDSSGRLPYSAGLRLARQLCRGLAAAHAVGVIHRDIKPENLILEPSGNAKLMDFGIARPAERLAPGRTQAGWLVGTPQYLAPEQLQGKEIDRRADLYATGVVLYEVFTGRLPFAAGSPLEVVTRTLREEPDPPSRHWPEVPPPLEALILTCLRKEPAERYADVETLLVDLDRLQA
jgi:serine/threonine-protein kinase